MKPTFGGSDESEDHLYRTEEEENLLVWSTASEQEDEEIQVSSHTTHSPTDSFFHLPTQLFIQ